MIHLGILVGPKGRGSNMSALAEACRTGELAAKVQVVIAPNDSSQAVLSAKQQGLNVQVCPYKSESYAQDLLCALQGCDLVCLAGYLRLLPQEVLLAFPSRVLNIHPALLPKFGGKGMYGIHVHEAVIQAKEVQTGCTVHFVSERYDEGSIILQRTCEVLPTDTPETLASRVLKEEHLAYPQAIAKVLEII